MKIAVKAPAERNTGNAWDILHESSDVVAVCQAWLSVLAPNIDRLGAALVILKGVNEDTFRPVAIWPDVAMDLSSLLEITQQVLERRQIIENRPAVSFTVGNRIAYPGQIALPLINNGILHGAVVIGLTSMTEENLRTVRGRLSLGVGWLIQLFWRTSYLKTSFGLESSALLLDLRLIVAEKQNFQEALISLVNNLTVRLNLKRVSLGWVEHHEVKVKAISHTAHFKYQHEAVQLLASAMQEAYDQRRAIVMPDPHNATGPSAAYVLTGDHEQLLKTSSTDAVGSYLLQMGGQINGVLTFEYTPGHPPTVDDVQLAEALSSQVAPILLDKWELDHWLGGKLKTKLRQGMHAVFGPDHPVYTLAAGVSLALLVTLAVVTGEFRVTAKTVIEGLVQRAAVAPFEGFIGQAFVRAGDRIQAGQLVATLDDKDLKLEKVRLESESAQTLHKYREAQAKHDRAAASVLGAKLDQTQAELSLVTEKLERANIKAPFDGYVVSGDLSQKLGAPVKQGDLLFEITPLDAYRVILQVDERDIAYLADGQPGQLTLTGVTGLKLPFTVKKVTPIAIAEEGANYFRVEAELNGEKPILRPGMEGVGKISVGEEKLWWIWTRRLFDWLSLKLWTWLP